MLYFGIDNLTYTIEFNSSCWHPIKTEKDRETQFILGCSFGWFKRKIISLSTRPSETQINVMDLFMRTRYNEIRSEHYMGSLQTEKRYGINIIFDRDFKLCWIDVRNSDFGNKAIGFSTYYNYPSTKWGCILENHSKDILLQPLN